MAEFTKWHACDNPDRAASDDADTALAARLELIPPLLDEAAPTNTATVTIDIEAVHQLRVATRRSRAALDAFRKFLPKRRHKRMQQRLSEIRRAAGAARDLDVLAQRYPNAATTLPADALDWLSDTIFAERRAAQQSIADLQRTYGSHRLDRYIARLLRRIKWRGKGHEPTFAELAKRQLAAAADEFFHAVRQQPTSIDELHELRIAGKHLRYSIELFGDAFSKAKNRQLTIEVYPAVEELQERLGRLNDHATATARILAWQSTDAAPASASAIVERERQQLTAARDEFNTWWTADHAAHLANLLADWS